MRKVAGKKRDMENGEENDVDAVESGEEENGVDDADPLANDVGENGDAAEEDDQDQGDDYQPDDNDEPEEDEDKPLKASKKAAKKEKKAAKKAAKKKKAKKRVSLNVPADKVDPEDEEDEEYEVQEIVSHRYVGNRLEYKIRWKGYSAKDDTWEAKNSLSCPDVIKKYEAKHDTSQKGGKKGGAKRKAGKAPAKSAKKAKYDESEDESEGDEDAEYEVAKLIEVKVKKNGNREFLVHWKGWSSRFDNWEPEENLNCDDLIAAFDKKLKNAKSATQKELRLAPKSTKRYVSNTKPKGARASKRGGGKQRISYAED